MFTSSSDTVLCNTLKPLLSLVPPDFVFVLKLFLGEDKASFSSSILSAKSEEFALRRFGASLFGGTLLSSLIFSSVILTNKQRNNFKTDEILKFGIRFNAL